MMIQVDVASQAREVNSWVPTMQQIRTVWLPDRLHEFAASAISVSLLIPLGFVHVIIAGCNQVESFIVLRLISISSTHSGRCLRNFESNLFSECILGIPVSTISPA